VIGYAAVIVCVLVISQITYRLIEAPFRKKSRDLVFRRDSRAAGALPQASKAFPP
jgi:peptidoglycan/LPS O-acetylase OafA/YrhL